MTAIETQYLDTLLPIHAVTPEEVTFLVDGQDYFNAIYQEIDATQGAGDCVYIVGWKVDPRWDPRTGQEDPPTGGLGQLLAQKRHQGVDVRLVLNGAANIHQIPFLPFVFNLSSADYLRTLVPPGATAPPLADRVLYDFATSGLTGSQHQKATVVKRGDTLTAFVGGMDFNPKQWDTPAHRKKEAKPGRFWGWHDIGTRLRGNAALGAWENFRNRWHEARTLPRWFYLVPVGGTAAEPDYEAVYFNPGQVPEAPPRLPSTEGPVSTPTPIYLQTLRTRYPHKLGKVAGKGPVPWAGIPGEPPAAPAGEGIHEVLRTLRKAIRAATRYIYIEDQFLGDQPHVFEIPSDREQEFSLFSDLQWALSNAEKPNLRLICVGSGRSDPGDPPPFGGKEANKEYTASLAALVDSLPEEARKRVVVFRKTDKTVHSKLVVIDDEFVGAGSANFQTRSTYGVDSELHAGMVTEGPLVRDLRVRLWSEHWYLDPLDPEILVALRELDKALGLWATGWYPVDPGLWPRLTHGSLGRPEDGIPGFFDLVPREAP